MTCMWLFKGKGAQSARAVLHNGQADKPGPRPLVCLARSGRGIVAGPDPQQHVVVDSLTD